MNYSKFVAAVCLDGVRRKEKRRAAGVSRRQKRRMLQFETLEDRRVMSVNPLNGPLNVGDGCRADEYISVTQEIDLSASQMRDVLLDSRTLGEFAKAAELSQYTDQQLTSTKEWVVLAGKGVSADAITAATGVSIARDTGILPWSYIVDASEESSSQLVSALTSTELVDYFYPLVPLHIEAQSTTNDPLLDKQWHLINFGQETGNPDFSPFFGTVDEDINIEGAWDSVTGKGVVIGIVDSGIGIQPANPNPFFDLNGNPIITLDTAHPDLAANLRLDLAIDLVDNDNDPSPTGGLSDGHGTAVAGIAAGVGNNGIGITGVAYEAGIAPIRLFSDDFGLGPTDATIAAAFGHEAQEIDIYNHSWGPAPEVDDQGDLAANPRTIFALGPLATVALRNSVFFGRKINPTDVNGLGGIHVFAAGNSKGFSDGGNFSEVVNSRYTISVTSVIEDGSETTYGEAGASVLVAAPSGSNPLEIIRDEQLGSGIVTTDLQGDPGFNQAPLFGIEIDADFELDTNYSTRFNGTSASAPIVSGVIALMLEANPNLSYRDVQHILVRSARQNIPTNPTWVTNNQQLFNDPLAFDSDAHLEEADQDGSFDGIWPFAQPSQEAGGTEEEPTPATPSKQVYYATPTQPNLFTNGAGLTVSQLTARSDIGVGHGVVDAALAVELARNWVTLGGQTSEFTWTTGRFTSGQINAGAITNDDSGEFIVPGGVIGDGNPDNPNAFIEYFNEFNKEETPAEPGEPDADPPVEGKDRKGPFDAEDPGDQKVNTRGTYIPIFPPAMTVEWVEVELDLDTGDANDYDFLRIVLVSPDGTQSELKNWHLKPGANDLNGPFHNTGNGHRGGLFDDPAGNITNDDAVLNAVFTTNRHWGERTEAKVRLNTDGTPVRGHTFEEEFLPTNKTVDNNPNPEGPEIVDGWKLVFENFSGSTININSYEVAFHGISALGTGRIQGVIGVDDNTDGFFSSIAPDPDDPGADPQEDNFSRYTEINLLDTLMEPPIDPDAEPLTDADQLFVDIASSDPYMVRTALSPEVQESWAAGAIVYVDLNANGTRDLTDPHYQLGADGNYFFDLPPNPEGETYDVRLDPNSLDAAGLLNGANLAVANAGPFAQVAVTVEGERIDGFAVEGDTITADDAFGFAGVATQTSAPDLNLVLLPNAEPEDIVNLSGVVYADLDENGIQDGDDAPIGGANVYVDLNQNGVFTTGFDPLTTTDADGNYTFADLEVTPGFYSVVVLQGTTGTFNAPVNPSDADHAFFFAPGFDNSDSNTDSEVPGFEVNLDFGFKIDPSLPTGGGTGVAISGIVYEDSNNNGQRGSFEKGLAGIATVYLDLNNNNVHDASIEPSSPTGANGSYIFNSLLPGQYTVRLIFDETNYQQTSPAGVPDLSGDFDPDDFESRVTIASGSVAGGVDFGLHNRAVADFGDLPSAFPVASHIKFGDLYLGNLVDAEIADPGGSDGTGDDTTGLDDEDGVVFGNLLDNSTTLSVTVSANTNGGFLQAWIDFNQDLAFQASEQVILETLLDKGETEFTIPVPAGLASGTVYARFRYGEQGISGFAGQALKGEVEDYAITVTSTAIDPGATLVIDDNPDFDADGDVDGFDFLAWQRGFGSNNASTTDGDANNDSKVTERDLRAIVRDFGQNSVVIGTGDFDSDGDRDGSDFLAWQRGVGQTASLSTGDGNLDGNVDGSDLQLWESSFGQGNGAAIAAAVQAPPSDSDLGHRISQPGFQEDLEAEDLLGVGVEAQGLASLASEVDRLSALRRDASRPTRSEYRLDHVEPTSAASQAEFGLALRDHVWEQLAAKQRNVAEETVAKETERLENLDTEEALAEAFGEEVNWRL